MFSQDIKLDEAMSTADSLLELGNYEQAIAGLRRFLDTKGKINDGEKETIASCYKKIAICYYKLDNYAEAIDWFQKALDLHREMGDLEAVATTLNNIGLNYKMRGNYDKAIEYYEQTIKIDEELGKGNEIAVTLNNIGMVYRGWGKYDKAIEYFERSLRLRTSLNDQPGVSKSLNLIGLVYTDWKKYDQAILNFRESLKIEESLKNESEVAIRLNNLGKVYFHMKLYDTALVYFNKTLLIQQKNNDLDQIALAFNNIGRVYLNQQKYQDASDYLSSALSIYDELGMKGEKATVLANLSDISRGLGNEAKALQLLDSSTLIAEKLNLRKQLQQNYLYYSDIYSDRKDYKKSLDYYKQYSEIKDSVFSEEILSQLSDFQIKYETEKKETEIELLKRNEEIQGLALKKQTIFRNSMLALSVLLLALAAMIFYSLQLKKKDNRIIASARQKSDQLLLNILPASIAQDLKETGKTEPQVFNDVTACFIDIVNFTQKSASLDPVVLIGELNQIFTAFDNIIEKYGCERIKTIGDSYMVVSGLPDYNPRHAHQVVISCQEMVSLMKKRNMESAHKWEIRVGIHTGEVIAGVVGIKKYIYDVFGDTINTASRMESNSEPMKINISESTYNLVKDDFETEFRGELEVKGKGKLKMYFISG
jgi:adenylate cyclase